MAIISTTAVKTWKLTHAVSLKWNVAMTSSGMTTHNLADSHQMLCYQIPNQS